MFKILDKFRDNDDPELCEHDGQPLATMSKEDLLKLLSNRGVDGLALCRVGAIKPVPEFLCRLAHYAIVLNLSSEPGTSKGEGDTRAGKGDGPSESKKAKVSRAPENEAVSVIC